MVYVSVRRAFIGGFRETFAGHLAGISGLLAGVLMALRLNVVFSAYPLALVAFPAVLTANSAMVGLFSGRLHTALHIGLISPRIAGNGKLLWALFQPVLTLTFGMGVLLSSFSEIFSFLLMGFRAGSSLEIFITILATMNLGLLLYAFILPFTFKIFKGGFDLDGVATPVVAAFADLFITVCYVFVLNFYSSQVVLYRCVIYSLAVAPAFLIFYALVKDARREQFIRVIKESILAIISVAAFGTLAGIAFQRTFVIANGSAGVMIAYPAMIEVSIDLGSIVYSSATAKLTLGLLKPEFSSFGNHLPEVLGAWSSSVILFSFFAVISQLFSSALGFSGVFAISTLLETNVVGVFLIVCVSFILAILTFRKGLDPDHLVAPIQSSLGALFVSVGLIAAILLHL